MKNLTKEQILKAAQEQKQTLKHARNLSLMMGFTLVLFAMWGILFNTDIPQENYAVIMAIGAIVLGIAGIKK
jgi:hypothetical protein